MPTFTDDTPTPQTGPTAGDILDPAKIAADKAAAAVAAAAAAAKKAKATLNSAVKNVIAGNYGNGSQRIDKLKAEGYTDEQIQAIQKQVNLNLNKGSTQWNDIKVVKDSSASTFVAAEVAKKSTTATTPTSSQTKGGSATKVTLPSGRKGGVSETAAAPQTIATNTQNNANLDVNKAKADLDAAKKAYDKAYQAVSDSANTRDRAGYAAASKQLATADKAVKTAQTNYDNAKAAASKIPPTQSIPDEGPYTPTGE